MCLELLDESMVPSFEIVFVKRFAAVPKLSP